MTEKNSGHVLTAVHLSSLYPSKRAKNIHISSSFNRSVPLPSSSEQQKLPKAHATVSFVFTSPATGDILVRVIENGSILELSALQRRIDSLRLVFPSPLLGEPALDVWHDIQLRVLVVTEGGCLFRLAFSLRSALWQESVQPTRWCQEYRIRSSALVGPVRAHGYDSVVVGLRGGGLLMMEARTIGDAVHQDDEWTESVLSAGNLLGALTAFIPFQASGSSERIVAIASLPYPTEQNVFFSLSNTLQLKAWFPRIGCIAQQAILNPPDAATSRSRDVSDIASQLGPQALLRILPSSADNDEVTDRDSEVQVVVYTPPSFACGHILHLYGFDTQRREFRSIGSLNLPNSNGFGELVDLMVQSSIIYTLWNHEAKAVIRKTSSGPTSFDSTIGKDLQWQEVCFATGNELDAETIEDILGGKEVNTALILRRLLKPGLLSPASIEEALDQYAHAILSLPQTPPPALTKIYSSLGERITSIVGCTVLMVPDPDNGLPRRQDYQAALRRDWEGFVARCLAIERGARCPLSISSSGHYSVLICDRERVSTPVKKEHHIAAVDALRTESPRSDLPAPLTVGWQLRKQLGLRDSDLITENLPMLSRENSPLTLLDIIHDVSFKWRQSLRLQAQQVSGLLHEAGYTQGEAETLCSAARMLLQIDQGVKRESQNADNQMSWELYCAFVSSACSTSIEARYDLAQSLAIYLLLTGVDLTMDHNQALWMSFAAFKNLVFLKSLSTVPDVEDEIKLSSLTPDSSDPLPELRYLNVATPPHSRPQPILQSILFGLVSPPARYDNLYGAMQETLYATGLFNTSFPVHLLPLHLMFCEQLRGKGLLDLALQYLSLFPSAPGAMYSRGLIHIAQGQAFRAGQCFDSVAGYIETELDWEEDRETLESILTDFGTIDSLFLYYSDLASRFGRFDLVTAAKYARLALDNSPADAITRSLWKMVIQTKTQLCLFEDAYLALMECPLPDLKTEMIDSLIQNICDTGATHLFTDLSFAGITEQLESALMRKARNADCFDHPSYPYILYSWYLSKGDYRSAAVTIYEHAQKLRGLAANGSRSFALGKAESDAYLLAMNALSLLDSNNAWIVVPLDRRLHGTRKRQKLRHHIPDDLYSEGCLEQEAVDIVGLRREFAIVNAELELAQLEGQSLMRNYSQEAFSPNPDIELVSRYADIGRFNAAFALAETLALDLSDLFQKFTEVCLSLKKPTSVAYYLQQLDWLNDLGVGATGTLSELAWQYLDSMLTRCDSPGTGYSYRKLVIEKIVQDVGPASLPRFLINFHTPQLREDLFAAFVKFGYLVEARDLSIQILPMSSKAASLEGISRTPCTLLEQLLTAANNPERQQVRTLCQKRLRSDTSSLSIR